MNAQNCIDLSHIEWTITIGQTDLYLCVLSDYEIKSDTNTMFEKR